LARVFARNGHDVALTARRGDRLEALATELASSGRRPIVIAADLEKPGAAQQIAQALAEQGAEVKYLVNNAGYGLIGAMRKLDRADQMGIVDVNVRALTDLSLTFADSVVRHNGGILNVASVAGFLPGPGMAVYYASKAFVVSLSAAMHAELRPLGVNVCALCPGPVRTEFGARAGTTRSQPNVLYVSAVSVAEQGYRGLMAGKRVVIPGLINKLAVMLVRVLPRGLLLAAISSAHKRRKASS